MSNPIDDILNAKDNDNRPFLDAGKYVLAVESSKYKKGEKGESFILEVRVIESSPAPGCGDPTTVGTGSVIIEKFEKKGALSRIKTKIARMAGKATGAPSTKDVQNGLYNNGFRACLVKVDCIPKTPGDKAFPRFYAYEKEYNKVDVEKALKSFEPKPVVVPVVVPVEAPAVSDPLASLLGN